MLERVSGLHPKVIDLSLDRVLALLARLGRPQDHLPPVIHVAGTNGKGSTVAFLRAMLEAAGKRVHVYTSPHLVRFCERIRVAGELIAEPALLALLEEVEAVNAGAPITFFEITTVAALLAFSRVPADVVILETGLGGRLDATNVVDRPVATVITPVAMDHEAFLGDTLAAIAGEKAGIIKAGTPCILAAQQEAAAAVVLARAAALAAPLIRAGVDFRAERSGAGLVFHGRSGQWDLPAPALVGAFQIDNAAVALAVLETLSQGAEALWPDVGAAAWGRGLETVSWPARLQLLRQGPLVAALPPGWELWLDGGHNPHGAAAIAAHAQAWGERPLLAIFGILANKDCDGYLAHLAPCLKGARAVAVAGEQAALPAEDGARALIRHGVNACASADPAAALAELVAQYPDQPARVLICGSLYLAGQVLRDNS